MGMVCGKDLVSTFWRYFNGVEGFDVGRLEFCSVRLGRVLC